MKGDRDVFNSESVTEGHPDKLCDQISDAIVGNFLHQDPLSRIAAECCVSSGILFVSVKTSSSASVDVQGVARRVITEAGYVDNGFSAESCTIITNFAELPWGERRVDESGLAPAELDRIAATDQVTVFGYACDQTQELMPLPITLARKLARRLAAVRRNGLVDYLTPDGKAQVGVEYQSGRPLRIHGVTLVASQKEHGTAPDVRRIESDLRSLVIDPVFRNLPLKPDRQTRVSVNPTGEIFTGGPGRHAGLTGRKTASDTYGEFSRFSGSALSGKDPSRIERIGTYAARYAAKNVVASGLASQCEIQLSYAIGFAGPVSIKAQTFGTGALPDREISRRIQALFDFRPAGIVRHFNLRFLPRLRGEGFYRGLAAYGQLGRDDLDLPWEATDKAALLGASTSDKTWKENQHVHR